jgi:hypothetical protein
MKMGPRRGGPPPPSHNSGTADLPLLSGFDQPVVEVSCGLHQLRFAIDTGAMGFARISGPAAQELNLETVGEAFISDPSGLNPVKVPIHLIPELKLGGLVFSAISAEQTDMLPSGVHGILGLDLFLGFVLRFDRRRGRMQAMQGSLRANGAPNVFTSPVGPALSVPVKIGSETFQADIDTGQALQPLMLPTAWLARVRRSGIARAAGLGRTISQRIPLSVQQLRDPVLCGTVRLPINSVAWPSAHPSANLGWKAFEGLVLSLDRQSQTVSLSMPN